MEIERGEIRPAPRLGANVPASYVDGVARLNDEVFVVLDLDNALSWDDASLLHGIDGAPAEIGARD